MRIRFDNVDYAPEELYEQVPFEAEFIRMVPGPDRPDYWLASLIKPLRWNREGQETEVTHLVLAARFMGMSLEPGLKSAGVNIVYVVDPSVLNDTVLDFNKGVYVAIGIGDID
jgi:hypothetical protein